MSFAIAFVNNTLIYWCSCNLLIIFQIYLERVYFLGYCWSGCWMSLQNIIRISAQMLFDNFDHNQRPSRNSPSLLNCMLCVLACLRAYMLCVPACLGARVFSMFACFMSLRAHIYAGCSQIPYVFTCLVSSFERCLTGF